MRSMLLHNSERKSPNTERRVDRLVSRGLIVLTSKLQEYDSLDFGALRISLKNLIGVDDETSYGIMWEAIEGGVIEFVPSTGCCSVRLKRE